jgi:hypothetical protein
MQKTCCDICSGATNGATKGAKIKTMGFVLSNDFLWCALDYDTAVKYADVGVNVYTLKPKRSLKLIDITNENFHKDFMNKVNNYYALNKKKETEKWKSLVSLGLPSIKIQMQHLPPTRAGVYPLCKPL